jgi:hypothetical protein
MQQCCIQHHNGVNSWCYDGRAITTTTADALCEHMPQTFKAPVALRHNI